MRAIVTRPEPQAGDWVARLRAAGVDAVALPLIAIAPVADAAPLQAAWSQLPAQRLAVFVSPNAAAQFFAARPVGSAAWPPGVLAASTGPGTTQALLDLGVPAAQIAAPAADAAQFDSEALWQQLRSRDWRGAQVLIVRGDGGREWLADTLRAQGADVAQLAAYRRCAPRLDAAQSLLLRDALAAPREHVWCFSSSEAVANLAALAGPAADWSAALAIATHPRIAARAQQLGIGHVTLAAATLAALRACIQSTPP